MKNLDFSRFSDVYSLRRLRPEDAEAVFELTGSNPDFYLCCGGENSHEAILRDMEALPPGKGAEDKYYLGYFDGAELAAVLDFIDGYPDANTAYIGFFMLKKCMQGRGIASTLIEKLCVVCADLGYRQVMLGWIRGNLKAEKFWRRRGFVPLERQRPDSDVVSARRELKAPPRPRSFRELLAEQAAQHPSMRARDALKMCVQAARGAEHAIGDRNAARKRLREELKAQPGQGSLRLYEQISPELCRVNLRAWKARGMKWQWLYSMFASSAGSGDIAPMLEDVRRLASEGALPFSPEDWEAELAAWDGGAVGHSGAYRAAESPAYRVVPMRFVPAMAVMEKMAAFPEGCVVAIDGRSNSGKTSLAAALAEATGAGVVHMDDFCSPASRSQVTALGYPGGNVDYAMFRRCVLPYIRSEKAFSHETFDCVRVCVGKCRRVKSSPYRVVEGSYSQHTVFGEYMDIRVFMSTDSSEQSRRVLARDGERLARSYFSIWIPQEEEYFDVFGLREKSDVVIDT